MAAMAEEARGFVLQPTYRIEAGRSVVHLFGVLEGGGSFLVRDTRCVPHFFVRLVDAGEARRLGAQPLEPTQRTTLAGEPVARVDVAVPADAPPLRDRLHDAGIPTYEADIRFAMRYLIDRGIRGSLLLRGLYRSGYGIDRIYQDPEVRPGDWTPRLAVLSFDIETDRDGRVLSIALVGAGASDVLLAVEDGRTCPAGATPCASEADLLRAFCRRVREIDPDVLTGWNVVDFDFPALVRAAKRHRIAMDLGRVPGETRVRAPRSNREAARVLVSGRVVLDGILLLRGTFVRFDDYSLDAVAREVLGEGKTLAGPDRAEEIWELHRCDLERFVEYNRTDARLVIEILEKLRLVELAVERSRLTGLPPDRVSASVAAFDFLYLSELGTRGVVAPSVTFADESGEPNAGGHVLEPCPGLYENVWMFDFKSLYPSIVRTFQIDPLGYVRDAEPGSDPIVAPNGASFRRDPGILPGLLDELFPRREEAKQEGDWIKSQAIKILMNSFYGVLGTPASRFHSGPLANAITSFGREILRWSRTRIESHGYGVLYGDTDSLFVESGIADGAQARRTAEALAERLNRELGDHVRRTWSVESRLELEFDQLYRKLFLPRMRHQAAGARKRYVGLVDDGAEGEVVFVGMEVVRRDWTELAKRVQRELYRRLFRGEPLGDWLRDLVRELREGRLDGWLVYRKGLRKDPSEYRRSTPPHVAAARKMTGKPGSVVAYVMTRNGPEPAGERSSPLDYEHYLHKQIRPVAEPPLQELGLDFECAAGLDQQLRLF